MSEETIKCPHCFSDISPHAAVCPVCKRDVKPVKTRSRGGMVWWLVIGVLVVICCGASMLVGLPLLAGLSAVGETVATSEAVEASTTREPAPPFSEILANYREMTDAQWNAYGESLVGKRATGWEGTITEVDEGEVVGNFTVFVRVDGAEMLEDVYIDVPESTAMALRKDQRIEFSGDITTASNAFGLTIRIDNAEIKTVEANG